jgi:hypothetical protein
MEQSVPSGRQAVQAGGFFHSVDQIDEMSRLINQAQGLAYLLGQAGNIETLMPERVRNAAWGLEDMLDRLHELVRHPAPESGAAPSDRYGQEDWRIDPLADWLIDHQPELAKDLIGRGHSQARQALIRAMDRRIAAGVGVRHD